MSAKPAKSSRINDSSRCTHRFANGKRCRLPLSQSEVSGDESFARKHFCSQHAKLPDNQREPDVAADLTGNLGDLTSAAAINDFLRRLLTLLAQDRISTRRAAVLAYITSQLLRTVSVINKQAENEDKPTHIEYVINVPRPQFEEAAQPS
jgi:hypothetical protein